MPLDSTTYESQVVRDLRAGRERLVTHGWCQHQTRDGERRCALGAVLTVTMDKRCKKASITLERALREKLSRPFVSVASWNDEPGRTVEEVLALYDFAIERELAHG